MSFLAGIGKYKTPGARERAQLLDAHDLEYLEYRPGAAQDSGDLEVATKTVTATAEPGAADYSVPLDVPASPEPDLEVLAQGLRLLVNIVAFNLGATQLNVSVRRSGGANLLIDTHTAMGNQVSHATLTGADMAFGPQTYEVRFWVDQGSVDIDLVQMWKAVGATVLGGYGTEVLRVHRRGWMLPMMRFSKVGTAGGWQYQLHQPPSEGSQDWADSTTLAARVNPNGYVRETYGFQVASSPGYASLLHAWGWDGDLTVLEQFGVVAERTKT